MRNLKHTFKGDIFIIIRFPEKSNDEFDTEDEIK